MKFIFEVAEENHEEYKEGWKRVLQTLCRLSSEVSYGNFSEGKQNKCHHSSERLT
jgi:L-rhamnose mutarotase